MSVILFFERIMIMIYETIDMRSQVLVFLATYNEALNIEKILDLLLILPIKVDILVVDDNSPDGTSEKIREIQTKCSQIKLITRPAKLGLGSAHKFAINYALENNFDFLVTMDADLSHNPADIPRFLQFSNEVDFIIGTRWGANGSCSYIGVRRLLSKSANRIAKVALRTSLTEYTSSFRVFNRRALAILNKKKPIDDGYAFFIETIAILNQNNLQMREIGIDFQDREQGKSKIPKYQVFVSSKVIIKYLISLRINIPRLLNQGK